MTPGTDSDRQLAECSSVKIPLQGASRGYDRAGPPGADRSVVPARGGPIVSGKPQTWRVVAGVAAFSLAFAGCAKDDKGTLKAGCDRIKCQGERGGAKYDLRLPEAGKWNGTLLIYSHGYRQPRAVPPSNEPPNTEAASAPSDEVAQELLNQGYALVGSAYKTNGWAVLDGVEANEDLYTWFTKEVGNPERVYVWGHSLGGLITQTFAEKHPDWVDGVIPMCGVLAGTNMNLDLALDVTYALKTLGIVPELQLTGYESFEEAVGDFELAYDAILEAAKDVQEGAPKLLTIAALVDGPPKTKSYDGRDTVTTVSALVESIVTAVGYGTYGRWEIEQRVGGNPSSNEQAQYAPRVPESERGLLNLLAKDRVDGWLAQLDGGQRIAADESARQNADKLGNPTGLIKDPTVTLHTQFDPLVLVQNESVFAQRVTAQTDREADLVQLYTAPPKSYEKEPGAPFGAGHCNFSRAEHVGVVALLDDWVRTGAFPGPGRINAVFPKAAEGGDGTHGVDLRIFPQPWPAAAAS
jgi:pimeloyl-ACP methyl ester carboxylesterase